MSGTGGGTRGQGDAAGGAMDRFLTPEAMLTPGGLGGITMLASNALASNFGVAPSYIGLLLSFVFGLLVLASAREWWLRAIYYLLNSLIIFCVAFGSGNLVAGNGARARGAMSFNLVSFAYADDRIVPSSSGVDEKLATLQNDYAKLNTQYNLEVETLATLQKNGASQGDIDKQNAVIQDLQQRKDANLKLQAASISEIRANLSVNTKSAVQSKSFFKPWTNPFRSSF